MCLEFILFIFNPPILILFNTTLVALAFLSTGKPSAGVVAISVSNNKKLCVVCERLSSGSRISIYFLASGALQRTIETYVLSIIEVI